MKVRLSEKIQKLWGEVALGRLDETISELDCLLEKSVSQELFSVEFYKALESFRWVVKLDMVFELISNFKRHAKDKLTECAFKVLEYIFVEGELSEEQVSQITLKYWAFVEPELLMKYCERFKVIISEKELLLYSAYLILIDKPEKAALLSKSFNYLPKLQKECDIFSILVRRKNLILLKSLIRDDPQSLLLAVSVYYEFNLIKEAEVIIKTQNLDLLLFPDILEKKMQKTLGFMLKSKISIRNLIELTRESDLAISVLIKVLYDSSFEHPWMLSVAKYLHHLYHFDYPTHSHNLNLPTSLKDSKNTSIILELPPDHFAPSNPQFFTLPSSILVIFVSDFQSINSITWPSSGPIGLDTEWKTGLEGHSNLTSILQISTASSVYIIDLPACNHSRVLDSKLYDLFINSDLIKLGIGFDNDLKKLKQNYPKLLCFQIPINNYIDLVRAFAVHYQYYPGGLSGLCEVVLKVELCKQEQMSNWDNRPLRKAQMHYAACDVYVCILIYETLKEVVEDFDVNERQLPKSYRNGGACEICYSKVHTSYECRKKEQCAVCARIGHCANKCPCIIIG